MIKIKSDFWKFDEERRANLLLAYNIKVPTGKELIIFNIFMFFKFNITTIKKIVIGAQDIIVAPIFVCDILNKFFILSIRYFSKYDSLLLLFWLNSQDILG